MAERLEAARRRFATRSVQLQQEILRNPEFRSLCEDYGEALDALERWSNTRDPMSSQRTSEYRLLVEELEKEIESYLASPP